MQVNPLPDLVIKVICKDILSKEQLCNSYNIEKKNGQDTGFNTFISRTFSNKLNARMKEELFFFLALI